MKVKELISIITKSFCYFITFIIGVTLIGIFLIPFGKFLIKSLGG